MTLEGDSLAQLVEHIPFKDGVLGSNPRRITKGSQFATLFLFTYLLNTAQFKKALLEWRNMGYCRKCLPSKYKFGLDQILEESCFIYKHLRLS